jgi:hypothetical protein
MDVKPTPKSVGAIKKVCMRASQLSSARAVAYVAGKSTRNNRTLFSRSVSTGHKVIVICLARTPATAKGLTYFFLALRRIEHPFP